MNLFKKIFSPICLTLSIFLFIYVFFKSQIYWNGEKNSYYQIYFIISLILIIFSILTFYLNQKIKEYVIIILVSAFTALYLFEIYITFNQIKSKDQRIKKQINIKQKKFMEKTGDKFDIRSRYEIYSDLKREDSNIQVTFHSSDIMTEKNNIFSFAGISKSKTINCNENGYYSIYESDRYGFNNPDKEWDQKKIEFFLIGDSHTHGSCVNRPNDIASVLRTLSKKPALNLGYSGWGPLIQYAILREYLISDVQNILWIYFEGNDLDDLTSDLGNDLLRKYLENSDFSQNLKKRQNEIDDFAKRYIFQEFHAEKKKINIDLIKFFKLQNVRRDITKNFKKKEQKKPPITEFKKILSLVQQLAEENNSNLYFVYLPEYRRYKNNYDHPQYIAIKNIVNELDIPFIDIHQQVFKKEQNPLILFPFELFGHFTEEGYKKTAQTIYRFIK